jgi:DNA-binding CsgD family transcriptional regulator
MPAQSDNTVRQTGITASTAVRVLLRYYQRGKRRIVVFLNDGVAELALRPTRQKKGAVVQLRRKCVAHAKALQILSVHLGLSQKQAQTAYALAEGLNADEIATRLDVTVHTAKRHTEAVYMKLKVPSRGDLEAILAKALTPFVR